MPRSMAHPDYVYAPWSQERRQKASEAAKERLFAARESDPRINPQWRDILISKHGTEVHVVSREPSAVKFRYSDDPPGMRYRKVTLPSWREHFKDAAYIVRSPV